MDTLTRFNFYRRYKWSYADFEDLQEASLGYPSEILRNLCAYAVLEGLKYDGATGLVVDYTSGTAINNDGDMLKVDAGSVTVDDGVKSLVVIRPVFTDNTVITRPTSPFDPVYLKEIQSAEVVAIAGSNVAFPSKLATDVILFGVTASGGVITQTDLTQCELLGKLGELATTEPFNKLVGNQRHCHYRDLAAAMASAGTNDRFRVIENQALTSTVTISASDVSVQFDPSVTVSKSGAATGILISGSRVRMMNGRFNGFSAGGDKAIQITGNYNQICFPIFGTNTTDVDDTVGTSNIVGALNE